MTTATSTFALDRQAAAKQRLAQLLAAEGITVEWNPKARTASFNLANRKVTMPVWKDIPEAAVDMLLAHEVAHALWSKDEVALMAAIDYIDPKNKQVAKAYLNVTEDPRIERLMKAKFVGIKADFAKGYRWMFENDFFGLSKVGGDIGKMPLIDRVNLHYKVGFLLSVPFTAEELPLVQKVAATTTWDEMVEVAKELYDFAKGEGKAEDQNGEDGEEGKPDPDGEETEAEGDETEAEPTEAEGDETEAEADEAEADGDETEAEADGDETEADEAEADADADGDDGEDETEAEADADGDETEDEADGDETEAEADADGDADDEDADDDAPPAAPTTMDNFDQNLADRLDTTAIPTYYADLPEIDKGIIVPLKKTVETLTQYEAAQPTTGAAAAAVFAKWKELNANAVQMLATEFDRRKAADELRRTATADTGAIDPNRLWAYKINDEIFAANTYVKDGKNHGLMVLLDMSASMSGIFTDTLIQVVNLAAFARRVNIPFRIYGFNDKIYDTLTEGKPFKANDGLDMSDTTMRLVTLFEDGMNQQTFQKTVGLMLLAAVQKHGGPDAYRDAVMATGFNRYIYTHAPKWLDLGNTPTNTAVLALSQVARDFKDAKGLQVVNLIVLTDGEPTDDIVYHTTKSKNFTDANYRIGTIGPYEADDGKELVNIVWRDKATRKEYKVTKVGKWYTGATYIESIGTEGLAAAMNQVFRDRVGGKVVAIHLRDRSGLALAENLLRNTKAAKDAEVEKLGKTWKDENWAAVANGRGYDDYIVIRTNLADAAAVDLTATDPTTAAGLRKLRNDFGKMLAATKGNRPLMVRVADLLAK